MTFRRISADSDRDPPKVETRPQRPPPPHLNLALSRLFTRIAAETRHAEPALIERWADIAGRDLARLGRPGRIVGGVKAATLEVIAPNGAAAARLQFEAEALRQRANQFLGPGRIGRIAVRQSGATDAAPVESALSRFRAALVSRAEKP